MSIISVLVLFDKERVKFQGQNLYPTKWQELIQCDVRKKKNKKKNHSTHLENIVYSVNGSSLRRTLKHTLEYLPKEEILRPSQFRVDLLVTWDWFLSDHAAEP